jgi:hypothetical protein
MIAQCSQDWGPGSGYDASMSNHREDRLTPADIPTLSPRGAFVVECGSGEAVSGDRLSGRVEHIVSGRATSFQSSSQLLAFMHAVLHRAHADAGAAGAEDARPARDELDGLHHLQQPVDRDPSGGGPAQAPSRARNHG